MLRQRPSIPLWPVLAIALLGTSVLVLMLGVQALRWNRGWPIELRQLWLYGAQGTHAALVTLAAIWVALGRGRLSTRVAVSLAWMLVLLAPWCLGARPRLIFFQCLNALVVGFGVWTGALVLLAAARRFGIRLVDSSGRCAATDPRDWQFSIFGMFVLTTEAGVAISLWRLLGWNQQDFQAVTYDDFFWMLVRIVNCLLVLSTIITCFHVPRVWWHNLLISMGFLAAIVLLHAAALVQYTEFPLLPPRMGVLVWGVHYSVMFAWLMGALAIAYAHGFRLRRSVQLAESHALAMEA
jgi:hypothetical protein